MPTRKPAFGAAYGTKRELRRRLVAAKFAHPPELVLEICAPDRDQKLQQITLSMSLTMIELPVMAGCAQSADCAI